MDPYVSRFGSNPNRESKQIHDPVAGVIEVRAWELYILDSPLMQRLRYVRQLGVGQVLFPTCAYSRFEHSLGALQMSTWMFDSIVRAQLEESSPTYKTDEFENRRSIVRLAALTHDIGHCAFSHVSEKAYELYKPLMEAQEHYKTFYQTKVTASEAITLLILQSETFVDLLRRSKADQALRADPEDIAYRMRACIAGSKYRMAPDAFMPEVINGPVDCDKLDYLARDAHFAGVPIALDIERLLSKLRLAEVERNGETLHALVIVPSGMRALDELLVTRIFLYDKFYYHPKLMAAEEVIRAALRHLVNAAPSFASPVSLLELADDAVLQYDRSDWANRLKVDAHNADIKEAAELFRRIRNRDLPKRAFAFAARFMPRMHPLVLRLEGGTADDAASDAEVEFQQFGRFLEDPTGLHRLSQKIQARAKDLGVDTNVFVGHQEAKRAGSAMYLDVILPNRRVERAPSITFKSHEWTEAWALNKATSYVFSYEANAKIHLASERVLRDDYNLPTFAPSSWMSAKVDIEELEAERSRLPSEWTSSRVRPDYLETDEAKDRLKKQAEKLASFLHSLHDDGADLVEAWASQFPTGDLQDSAIALLEHFTFVEQHHIVAGFNDVAKREKLEKALWVPLVSSRDPGKSADVLLGDLRELKAPKAAMRSLSKNQLETNGHLVLFDDSLNSATQAITLVRSWLGLETDSRHESDRDDELSEVLKAALKNVRVTFVYYAVHPQGRKRLNAEMKSLGIGSEAAIHGVIDSSDDRYTLEGLRCKTKESKTELLDYLQIKGEQLLRPRMETKGWNADQAREYALGFGGLATTIAFKHSISSSAPVAIWEMSRGPSLYWLPVLPRDKAAIKRAIFGKKSSDVAEYEESRG